jgi:hypothetical protein
MIHLASDIPIEVLREPGFASWVVYALVALFLAKEARAWLKPEKREISGSIESKPAVQLADQADLDTLNKTVGAMREEITSQFAAARTHGENRVVAITTDVNTKMDGVSMRVGELFHLINQAMMSSAAHGEAIVNLKAADFRHDGQVAAIQNRIEELMRTGKPKH